MRYSVEVVAEALVRTRIVIDVPSEVSDPVAYVLDMAQEQASNPEETIDWRLDDIFLDTVEIESIPRKLSD